MARLLWRSTPKSTRTALLALVAVSVAIFGIKLSTRQPADQTPLLKLIIPYVQLVPRYAIFYPWVFVTAIFAEVSIFSFVLSFAVLFVSTGYVEKFWGYKELLKFLLLIGTLTNFFTVIITIVSNIFRSDVSGMDKPLGGGISYYFGFLIVLKQLIPEHNVVLFQGLINFRAKHLPFIVLTLVLAWSLCARALYPALPSVLSFFIAYNYLRFYQSVFADPLLPITTASGENSNTVIVRGDASDAFQLVEFFPSVAKPYLAPVFSGIYELSVLIGVVTPFNEEAIEQGNARSQKLSLQLKQANRLLSNTVAERRRQVALQVIEDRGSLA